MEKTPPKYRKPTLPATQRKTEEWIQVKNCTGAPAMATRHGPSDHGQSARPDNRSKANSELRALCSENKLFAKKRQLKEQETAYQCANAKVLYRSCQTKQI